MSPEWSEFGRRLACGSGIGELMDDLGEALAQGGDGVCMLGGGQPALIPEVEARWRQRMEKILAEEGGLSQMLSIYHPPVGSPEFREAMARYLRGELGWEVEAANIAVSSGGQTAFFFLFNSLAGPMRGGGTRRILLPLLPEYIGYANQGAGADLFVGVPGLIERRGAHGFKYRVDFARVEEVVAQQELGGICVSRPTNPSGNVLTDEEVAQLGELARRKGIPLIVDNAYGAPFPGILFREVTPRWEPGMIDTFSLSKLGLPGTRTGIVVADPEVVRGLSSMTSIAGLANGNAGQVLVTPLVRSGELGALSREVIAPFYRQRMAQAREWVGHFFDPALPYRVHEAEGALFLWLWFEGLPISSRELYQRLKARGVLIIPGESFFYADGGRGGRHRQECIRVSYAMSPEVVRRGVEIIAQEVGRAYAGSGTGR